MAVSFGVCRIFFFLSIFLSLVCLIFFRPFFLPIFFSVFFFVSFCVCVFVFFLFPRTTTGGSDGEDQPRWRGEPSKVHAPERVRHRNQVSVGRRVRLRHLQAPERASGKQRVSGRCRGIAGLAGDRETTLSACITPGMHYSHTYYRSRLPILQES